MYFRREGSDIGVGMSSKEDTRWCLDRGKVTPVINNSKNCLSTLIVNK